MSEQPLVTVRMSAYNHERYVEQAVRSILEQTYRNIELLVIDDGSKDRTPDILEGLSREYGFYFVRQENQGLAATLNKLLSLSQGKYIAGLASDDYYTPDKIQRCVSLMEANPEFGFCHGRNITVDADGVPLADRDGKDKNKEWCEGNIFSSLLERGCFISGPTTMIRKSALDEVGSYDASCAIEDWDMWLRLSYRFPVGFIEAPLAYYRIHGTNTYWATKNYHKMYLAEKTILNKWRSYENFHAVYQRYQLRWFYRLAVTNRLTALRHAFSGLPNCTKSQYWKAWLRIFTGEHFSRSARVRKSA